MTTGRNRTILLVEHRRRPHEVLLLFGSAFLGGYYLLGAPPPHSVAATQPGWVIQIWAAVMLLSGLIGLVSVIWRRDFARALRLEGAAMDLGAGALILYATSLYVSAGLAAMGSGVTFALWAAANLWRSRQVRNELRDVAQS